MKIKLDDKYSVEADANSWNLHFKEATGKTNDAGEQTYRTDISYHSRLQDALNWYLSESLKESTDITDVLTHIALAESNIEKACAGITKGQPHS